MDKEMCKKLTTLNNSEAIVVNAGLCRCHCKMYGYLGTASSFQHCVGFCRRNGDTAVTCTDESFVIIPSILSDSFH